MCLRPLPIFAHHASGLWQGTVRDRQPFFFFLGLSFVAYLLLMAAWGSLGGWAYGARMLTDALPALCLLLVPVVQSLRGAGRAALWGVIGVAIFVHSLGIWDYGLRFHAVAKNSVWSVENNEPLFYLKLLTRMAQSYFTGEPLD